MAAEDVDAGGVTILQSVENLAESSSISTEKAAFLLFLETQAKTLCP